MTYCMCVMSFSLHIRNANANSKYGFVHDAVQCISVVQTYYENGCKKYISQTSD